MRKIVLAVVCAALLGLAAIASPVSGQGGAPPPPPPPPGGGPGGPPCPPIGCPTNTPTATPSATATPTATPTPIPPTATPTSIPCFVTLKLAHKTVKVGKKQKVTIDTLPAASVKITVTFPNKSKKTKTRAAPGSGSFGWNFKQPGNKTTPKSNTASVKANVTCIGQAPVSASKKYKIG